MNLETLIVDDDEIVVFLHKMAVVESGLSENPAVAFNGSQALTYISQHQTAELTFLILLDINMPEMDGWEFLNAIKALDSLSPIYVVMVTSSVDNRDRKKAEQYEQVIYYLEKPLSVLTCTYIKNLPQVSGLF